MDTLTEFSPTIGSLAEDLAKAQAEMRNPVKDTTNTFFKSKYADLATVRDAVLPVLAANNLSIVQLPSECESGPCLVTALLHSSGEYIKTTMLLRATKADPQGVGSAITYARRYALQSIAGVAADADDDGNAASRQAESDEAPQPMAPSDSKLVAMLEKLLDAASTKTDLALAAQQVKYNTPKLTPAGQLHLRDVYAVRRDEFVKKKAKEPERMREPGEDDPVSGPTKEQDDDRFYHGS